MAVLCKNQQHTAMQPFTNSRQITEFKSLVIILYSTPLTHRLVRVNFSSAKC